MPDYGPPVSLGIRVPETTGSGLGTVGEFAKVQNYLNEAKLFGQTFEARQRAGQIMSASPDLETALDSIQKDPVASAFAPQIANSIRQVELTQTQIAKSQQEQFETGLGAYIKSLAEAYNDPDQLKRANERNQARVALLSPKAGTQLRTAADSITKSLTDDLPADPAARVAQYKSRMQGYFTEAGLTPEVQSSVTGTLREVDFGGRKGFGVQAPPSAGGAFAEAGSIPMGLAPQLTEVYGGGPKLPVGGAYGTPGISPSLAPTGSQAAGTARPSLALPTPSSADAMAAPMGAPVANGSAAPTGAPRIAGDGTPLFPEGAIKETPNVGRGVGGIVIPASPEVKKQLGDQFAEKGMKEYESANQTAGNLREADHILDEMIKGGGFLQPGAMIGPRTDLAKLVNTAAQILNVTPPFDANKIGSIEDFNKLTKRMGLSVTSQFLGGQREPAMIIQGVTSSVPNAENTYLGGKLVTSSLGATMQRQLDLHDFQLAWMNDPRNQGNLTGAVERFNELHPPQQYVQTVLDKFGLTPNGFKSEENVKDAVRMGYLTRKQGEDTLKRQWPERFQ